MDPDTGSASVSAAPDTIIAIFPDKESNSQLDLLKYSLQKISLSGPEVSVGSVSSIVFNSLSRSRLSSTMCVDIKTIARSQYQTGKN